MILFDIQLGFNSCNWQLDEYIFKLFIVNVKRIKKKCTRWFSIDIFENPLEYSYSWSIVFSENLSKTEDNVNR